MDDLARYKIPSVWGFFGFPVNSLNVIPVSPLEHIVPEENSATDHVLSICCHLLCLVLLEFPFYCGFQELVHQVSRDRLYDK